jgi:hypothetical protein
MFILQSKECERTGIFTSVHFIAFSFYCSAILTTRAGQNTAFECSPLCIRGFRGQFLVKTPIFKTEISVPHCPTRHMPDQYLKITTITSFYILQNFIAHNQPPLLLFSPWLYSPLDLGRFFSFLTHIESVGLLGRGISPSQGRYLHAEQHKHRINTHRHPFLE